jgi:hypothetical protein
VLAKADKKALKSVFTVSTEVKQVYSCLFVKLIEELKNVQLEEGDNIETIREKLVDANTDCYSAYMFDYSAKKRISFGQALKASADVEQYFHNKILGQLPQYKANPVLIAIISQAFDQFIKATAYDIAWWVWYTNMSVNQGMFLSIMATNGMDQLYRDELQGSVRVKEVKPKKAKATPPATPTPAPPTTPVEKTAEELMVEKMASATVDEPTEDEDEELPEDDLDDMLASV